MRTNYEVVVIGGGIIGCAVAYYLAKDNVQVAVLEAGHIGARATSAAAGMLGAHSEYEAQNQAFFPFATHSQSLYTQLKEQLYADSGVDIAMQQGGILQLAFCSEEQRRLAAMLAQPAVTWLTADEVRRLEPYASSHVVGAAHIEADVHVRPDRVCEAFAKAAQVHGAELHAFTKVWHVEQQAQCVRLSTSAGVIEAKRIVVACGAWSTPFFQQLGIAHEMVPLKGECLSVKATGPMLQHTLFHDKCYIVPRNNGELIIGATMRAGDWSEQVSLNSIASLIDKAKQLMPAIGELGIISTWSGLRPQTTAQRPLIGYHPENESICFATGHGRNGILLAPATGELVANLLLKKEVKHEWVEAFRLDRVMEEPT